MDATPFVQAIAAARQELHIVVSKLGEMRRLEQRRLVLEQFLATAQAVISDEDSPINIHNPGLNSARDIVRTLRGSEAELPDHKLWEMILFIMQLTASPMTADEVLGALEREKFKVGGQHKRETVRGAVLRKPDVFERVGRGMFALKEWSDELKHSRDREDTTDPESEFVDV